MFCGVLRSFALVVRGMWPNGCTVSVFSIVGGAIALQQQNAICKTSAQYAKGNCAFELFKAHFAATIDTKNASFTKKKNLKRNRNFILKDITS